MALRDARFSRPSTPAFAMAAVGALSVGLISGGLWYDSHRSAEAVDRAREQVSAGQSAQSTPEPVVATTSERLTSAEPTPERTTSEQPAESSPEKSSAVPAAAPVQQWSAAQYVAPATSVPTAAATRPAPGAAARTAGDDTTARESATPVPPEFEVTQPSEPGFVPLPRLQGLLLPFLPPANPALQARLAPQAAAVAGQPTTTAGDGAAVNAAVSDAMADAEG